MMIRVAINRITENPYQTRLEYGGLEDLESSILAMKSTLPETSGLIHVPLARLVVAGEPVNIRRYGSVEVALDAEPYAALELASGHRRWKAFQLLSINDPEYATFPIKLVELDDQEMADIAWSENAHRRDISAVEEGMALEKAMKDFGWTQEQISERWGLNQSSVSRKLRLLHLPEVIKALIRRGKIGERQGRALLPLVDVKASWKIFLEIVEDGQPGKYHSGPSIEQAVKAYVEQATYSLVDAPWDETWRTESERACLDCPFRLRVGREWRCSQLSCYHAKQQAYKQQGSDESKALEIYDSYDDWELVVPWKWVRCEGCGRLCNNVKSYAAKWLKSAEAANYICPQCYEEYGLEPSDVEEPPLESLEPDAEWEAQHAAALKPSMVPSVVATDPELEAPKPQLVYIGRQQRSTQNAPAQQSASLPACEPIRRPATSVYITRSKLNDVDFEDPETANPNDHTVFAQPATLLTARIMPGGDLLERRVIVSIGEEGHCPALMEQGDFTSLTELLSQSLQRYFAESLVMEGADG